MLTKKGTKRKRSATIKSSKRPNLNDLRPTIAPVFTNLHIVPCKFVTQCFFTQLESHLIQEINKAEMIMGAVAWITSMPILKACLSKQCALVVQKERYFKSRKKSYQTIVTTYKQMSPIPELQCKSTIRCLGQPNKKGFHPLMHHKFVLFARRNRVSKCIEIYQVWTGSFNWSQTATRSLENAVILSDSATVSAYYDEFAKLWSKSEAL